MRAVNGGLTRHRSHPGKAGSDGGKSNRLWHGKVLRGAVAGGAHGQAVAARSRRRMGGKLLEQLQLVPQAASPGSRARARGAVGPGKESGLS
jgi:hypothetical protein